MFNQNIITRYSSENDRLLSFSLIKPTAENLRASL